MGGLGSPVALYLAGAGIGQLGVVDSDKVELSNLQRQMLFTALDTGKPKVEVARQRLQSLNPDTKITSYYLRVNAENVINIIKDYNLVVDASDNFTTRYTINDACVRTKKTLIHGAIFGWEGQAMVIKPGAGPCYRCLFPEPPPPGSVPSCQEAGILGAVAGVIGLVQATEALKSILEIGELLVGKLLVFNALEMNFRKVRFPKDENCPACGKKSTVIG